MTTARALLALALALPAQALAQDPPFPPVGRDAPATPEGAEQGDLPPPLRFGWPVPTRFQVTEAVVDSQQGRRRFLYDLALTAGPEGSDELLLRFLRIVPLEVPGRDLSAPDARAEVEYVVRTTVYPQLRIGRDGVPRGLFDWEGSVARWEAQVRTASPDQGEDRIAAMRARLLSPPYRQEVISRYHELWIVWVSAWIGARVAPGQTLKRAVKTPLMGELVDATATITCRPPPPGESTLGLDQETRIAGEPAREAFARLLEQRRDARGGGAEEGPPPRVLAFERVVRIGVVTEPATLRPRYALKEQFTTLALAGQPPQERSERREFTFVYSP